MIIVISVGGSVLSSTLEPKNFKEYADVIKKIAIDHQVFIVTGGGPIARKYISSARALGANEVFCDLIGIEVARLNARLLITALGDRAYPEIPLNYNSALQNTLTNKIVVMGGVSPGYTTDAVAAILAEYVNADLLINATSVDGVYTEDPKNNPYAIKLDRITPKQLIDIVIKTEMKAGSNSPFDPVAAKIIERCKIKTIVLDGTNPSNIIDAVLGKHNGTEIRY